MSTRAEQEVIRDHLSAIAQRNGGRLTPDMVVADARDEDSPLHSLFEWDTEKAAEAYWLDQARQIIRSVNVMIRTETTVVRAPYFVRDPDAGSDEQGYVTVTSVRTDADRAREVLVQEFSRVASMLQRAQQVAKALEMEGEVEPLVRGVIGLRDRLSAVAV